MNSTTSEEDIPLKYPVDLTEPVYRYDKTSSFLYMVLDGMYNCSVFVLFSSLHRLCGLVFVVLLQIWVAITMTMMRTTMIE